MKTEEILRYDQMYRAMREALDADIITFGFHAPRSDDLSRGLREHPSAEPVAASPYRDLSGAESL